MSNLDIKFIAVEVLKKDCHRAESIEYGIFKGIKTRSDGDTTKPELVSFILIEKAEEKDGIQAFNLNDFNILSIGSRCGNIEELVIYHKHDEDQRKASKLLHNFMIDLRKDKRMVKNDSEIVDVSTYTNLPGTFKSGISEKTASFLPKAIHSAYPQQNNNTTDWQKRKREREEEEARQEILRETPCVFKRKGKPPGVKALNLMRKKISLIAAGDYESEIVKEKELPKQEATKYLSG